MNRNLDAILAKLKADDWLANAVDIESIAEPKTSVATGIEHQYVMGEWDRRRVIQAYQEITEKDIELLYSNRGSNSLAWWREPRA